jgi:hypothetical protein
MRQAAPVVVEHRARRQRSSSALGVPNDRVKQWASEVKIHESRKLLCKRLPLLLEFISALEKSLYASYEGTMFRSAPSATAATFFKQNRKV